MRFDSSHDSRIEAFSRRKGERGPEQLRSRESALVCSSRVSDSWDMVVITGCVPFFVLLSR